MAASSNASAPLKSTIKGAPSAKELIARNGNCDFKKLRGFREVRNDHENLYKVDRSGVFTQEGAPVTDMLRTIICPSGIVQDWFARMKKTGAKFGQWVEDPEGGNSYHWRIDQLKVKGEPAYAFEWRALNPGTPEGSLLIKRFIVSAKRRFLLYDASPPPVRGNDLRLRSSVEELQKAGKFVGGMMEMRGQKIKLPDFAPTVYVYESR